MKHEHNWQFVGFFTGVGKEVIMQRRIPQPNGLDKLEMWTDSRCEYPLFVCECGAKKQVATKGSK